MDNSSKRGFADLGHKSRPGGDDQTDEEKPARGKLFGRLRRFGMADLDTAPPRDYLLKGVISPEEISIWVGAPKCGKSFLLLYVSYMLSLCRRVFGRRVKPTTVLYVAAEGEAGIAQRVRALRDRYGPSGNFEYLAQPIDLLHKPDAGHMLEIIDAATDCGANLIVIDTLNRSLAGGSENKPEDMGAFLTHISAIKYQARAHIAVIHHGTKASDGRSPRGHGSLEGADDALIEVMKLDDGSRVANLVHAKDDADGMRWGFKLDVVELGIDDDGDPVTTLIAVEQAETPGKNMKAEKPTQNEQIALTCLAKAMKTDSVVDVFDNDPDLAGRPVVAEIFWRKWFYAESAPGQPQDTKKKAFARAVTGLLAKRLIGVRGDYVWRVDTW